MEVEQYAYKRLATYSKEQVAAIREYYAGVDITDLRSVIWQLKNMGWTYSDILAIACRGEET